MCSPLHHRAHLSRETHPADAELSSRLMSEYWALRSDDVDIRSIGVYRQKSTRHCMTFTLRGALRIVPRSRRMIRLASF